MVAVDAPCSGEGMFRKMAEAREEWSAESPRVCAERQREILAEAWRTLRPGGTLIYSTCTFNPIEDESIVEWLTKEYGDELEMVDDIAIDEEWGIKHSVIGAFHCYHFYPHLTRGEGFFAAVARKSDAPRHRLTPKSRKKVFAPLGRADIEAVREWVSEPETMAFRLVGEDIYAYHASVVDDVTALSESLTVIYSGVAMGQIFKRKLKPDHALALYVGLNRCCVPVVELELDVALDYLRRNDIVATPFEEGINAVAYRGVIIGFVKRIGNRCNNMYPKDLRILKL